MGAEWEAEQAGVQRAGGAARADTVKALRALLADSDLAPAHRALASDLLGVLDENGEASARPSTHSLGEQLTSVRDPDVQAAAHALAPLRQRAEDEDRHLAQIVASRSWRVTAALRWLTRVASDPASWRTFSDAGPSRTERPDLAPSSRAGHDLPLADQLNDVELQLRRTLLPAADAQRPDIYLWAVIDWHFRTQRPQHLATGLAARGHRVFYISNAFIDRPYPGFTVEPLDGSGRLYQVRLYLTRRPGIYAAPPDPWQVSQLDAGLEMFAQWNRSTASISIVHHPFWTPLLSRAPSTKVVYDCIDHHAGFSDNTPAIAELEKQLLADADGVVLTSQWLRDNVETPAAVTTIRNAGDFAFFSQRPTDVFRDPDGRQVIGYYGAIENWLDVGLVRSVATAFPQARVVLIGRDTAGVRARLADLGNVVFVPEVPYGDLPYWLHGFDVCLLPFKVLPLTLATNPVKIYEYLSAGKPVVGVDLPEMEQFGDLVRCADSPSEFVRAVAGALEEPADSPVAQRRREFARGQTWEHRVEDLVSFVDEIEVPRVSVIVVTYGNLEFTRNCLASVERFSDWPNLEVIVVDNGSTDGTVEYLQEWACGGPSRVAILNDTNRGFAGANNQGLERATGDYLVLLNNDTYVTRGWIRGLVSHFRRDPSVGLVGPVTNNIGNEARIDISYADMEEMAERSRRYTIEHRGRTFPIRTLAFFCVAMSRDTLATVGLLDEDFTTGFFEDDDYCRRVASAGLRCVCAEDVFVHHHLSATFARMAPAQREALFVKNKAIYEAKWGAWIPHVYRSESPADTNGAQASQ